MADDRDRLRYLQLKAKAAESAPSEGVVDKALNLVDYPGRLLRTGIAKAGGANVNLTETASSPLQRPKGSASGLDVLNAFPTVKKALIGSSTEDVMKEIQKIPDPQLREYTLKKLLQAAPNKPDFKSIESFAGGLTEAVTDPLLVAGGPLIKGAGSVAGKGIRKIAPAAEKFANSNAVKSLGRLTPTESRALGTSGTQELGKTMLEGKVIGGIPTTRKALANKVTAALDESGKKIGSIVEKLSGVEDSLRAKGYQTGINKNNIVATIQNAEDLPHIDPQFSRLRDGILKNFVDVGGKVETLSLKDAQAFKSRLGSMINWKKIKMGDITDRDRVLTKLYDSLNNGIVDAAEMLSNVPGQAKLTGPGMDAVKNVGSEIKSARKTYSQYKKADDILSKQIAKDAQYNTFSLTDLIAGSAGGVAAGPAGVGLGLASKAIRGIGPQAAAIAGQGIANAAPKVAGGIEAISKSQQFTPSLLRLINSQRQGK